MSLEFLAEGNVSGQTLLKLVSRGSAVIAELQRLADHIPRALRGDPSDPDAVKYGPILFDFRYLKTPEMFDRQINTSAELGDIDTDFYNAHEKVLTRFYNVFTSILKYIQDLATYTQEVDDGEQPSLGGMSRCPPLPRFCSARRLLHGEHAGGAPARPGRQAADVRGRLPAGRHAAAHGPAGAAAAAVGCASATQGCHPALPLRARAQVQGPVRERLVVAHYRHKGESAQVSVADIAKLCRDTGFRRDAAQRPARYPEDYFAR